MGIPGLFSLLKYYEEHTHLEKLISNKRIGIDVFWFLYRCKGDLNELQCMLKDFYRYSQKCYLVFDGRVPDDKKDEKIALRETREKNEENIKKLEEECNSLEINERDRIFLKSTIERMKKNNWAPRGEFVETVKEICKNWCKNIEICIAPFEADTWLVEMERNGHIHYIVSNDSDLVVNGCINLIRPEIDRDGYVRHYNIEKIVGLLKCSINNWLQFCEMIKNYKGGDILCLYSWWRYYLSPEIIYKIHGDKFYNSEYRSDELNTVEYQGVTKLNTLVINGSTSELPFSMGEL